MLVQLFLFLAYAKLIVGLTLTVTVSSSTSQTLQCTTCLATTSGKTPVPTTSSTRTLPPEVIIIISASTPLTTVTPATKTITTTVTTKKTVTTTASSSVNTFSTTSTYTTTNSVISTSIIYTTSTSTGSTTVIVTSVIPAPSGFVGIEQSSGDTNYMQKRALLESPLERRAVPQPNGLSSTFPKSVNCITYITIIYTEKIVAVKPTSTLTVASPTLTSTVTATYTSTSTVLPTPVSVTSTFSTTQTVVTTITTSSLSTITASTVITTSSTTTSYAACFPTNILGPEIQDGSYLSLSTPADDGAQFTEVDGITNAYDCCVACITGSQCQYSEFLSSANACANFGNDPAVCDNPNYIAGTFSVTSGPNSFMAVYSNGPCGVLIDQRNSASG